MQDGAFADWSLSVEGRVATPRVFSLADLKQLPSRTQITRHTCEEGWTAIGQWTGVPLAPCSTRRASADRALRHVLFLRRLGRQHRHARRPASADLLAYGMNGRDLPIPHGAPVRLRVERQIGYKSMKFLQRIVVRDKFDDGGKKGNIQNGWAWYTGI